MLDRVLRIVNDTAPLLVEIIAAASLRYGGALSSNSDPGVFVMSSPGSALPIDVDAVDAEVWERAQVDYWARRWGCPDSCRLVGPQTAYLRGAAHHVHDAELVRLVRNWEVQRMRHLSRWPLRDETTWVTLEEAARVCKRSLKTVTNWSEAYPGMTKHHPTLGPMLDVRKLALVNDRAQRRSS